MIRTLFICIVFVCCMLMLIHVSDQQIEGYHLVNVAGSNYTDKISSVFARPITKDLKLLATDFSNGDIYFFDMGMIRKIDSSLNIINIAGSPRLIERGNEFESDLFALNAWISNVKSLAVDYEQKHVYFIDETDGHIKQINSETGLLTTIVGGGIDPNATLGVKLQLENAKSLTITKDGKELFILDGQSIWKYNTDTFRIQKFIENLSPSTVKILFSISEPFLYLLDSNKNAILKYSSDMIYPTTEFSYTYRIQDFVILDNHIFFLSNQTLQAYDGSMANIISGKLGVQSYLGDDDLAQNALFHNPNYLAINSEKEIFIMDSENQRIRKIQLQNSQIQSVMSPFPNGIDITANRVSIGEVIDMSFDLNFKYLYICDKQEQMIRRFNQEQVETLFTNIDCDGIAVNSQLEIFISVKNEHRIYKIMENGEKIVVAGNGNEGDVIHGVHATESSISNPTKIRLLQNGDLIVLLKTEISKIESSGIISLFSNRQDYSNLFVDLETEYVYYGNTQTVFRQSQFTGDEELMAGFDPNSLLTLSLESTGQPAIGYNFDMLDGIVVANDGILYLSTRERMFYVKEGQIYDLNFVDKMSGQMSVSIINRPRILTIWENVVYLTTGQNNIYVLRRIDTLSCFNLESNLPTVCSGRGVCTELDKCTCPPGFYGLDCRFATCFNIQGNQAQLVCNAKGSCFNTDICSCQSGYTGTCLTPVCYGLSANDSGVCSGRGTCSEPNNCLCNSGYEGSRCEFTSCFGLHSNSSFVCSGNGKCVALDTCSCENGYIGSNCLNFTCFGKEKNDTNVCSGNGLCVGPNRCTCHLNYEGSQCDDFTCFGIKSNQSQVCSGNGKCQDANKCNCTNGYFGSQCENFTCFNLSQSDSQVCSGRGSCIDYNNCNCKSELGFVGANCSTPVCYGYAANSTRVCSGNGECIQPDTCQCNYEYFGLRCELVSCFGILSNDSKVCSGHGSCSSTDSCQCIPQLGYIGNSCEISTCFGISSNSTSVCSGNGDCQSVDSCLCKKGYIGNQCQTSICIPIWSEEDQAMTCVKPSTNSSIVTNIETVPIVELASKVISLNQSVTPSVIRFPSDFYQFLIAQGLADMSSQITILSSINNAITNTSETEIQLISPIVTMSLFRNTSEVISVSNLQNPIEISFSDLKLSNTDVNVTCMFFDITLKEWKPDGIKTILTSTTGSDESLTISVTCQTTHLTSFAIIDPNYKKATNNRQEDTIIDLNKLSTGEIIAIAVSIGGSALILLVIGALVVVIVGVYLRMKKKNRNK